MVRRAKRSGVHDGVVGRKHPCNRVDAGSLDGFLKAELGQDGGQALGKHTFSGAGRSNQQQVVPAGSGNLQCPFGKSLSAHLTEVLSEAVAAVKQQHRVEGERSNLLLTAKAAAELFDVRNRIDLQAVNDGSFFGVGLRDIQTEDAVRFCLNCHRKNAVDGTQLTGQTQLADKSRFFGQSLQLLGGKHDRQKDGQVEGRTRFFLAGRSQIDGDFGNRQFVAGVDQSGLHPRAGFLDGGIGQSDHIEGRNRAAECGFHRDRIGINPVDSIAFNATVH